MNVLVFPVRIRIKLLLVFLSICFQRAWCSRGYEGCMAQCPCEEKCFSHTHLPWIQRYHFAPFGPILDHVIAMASFDSIWCCQVTNRELLNISSWFSELSAYAGIVKLRIYTLIGFSSEVDLWFLFLVKWWMITLMDTTHPLTIPYLPSLCFLVLWECLNHPLKRKTKMLFVLNLSPPLLLSIKDTIHCCHD